MLNNSYAESKIYTLLKDILQGTKKRLLIAILG